MSDQEERRKLLKRALLGGVFLLLFPRLERLDLNLFPKINQAEAPKPNASSVSWKRIREEVILEAWARALAKRPEVRRSAADLLPLVKEVTEQARIHNVRPSKMLALIVVESGAQREAVSPAGARGHLQILPATGRFIARSLGEDFKEEDLFDRRINVRYGTWYYQHLEISFGGNEKAATAAYNWGPEAIRIRYRNGEGTPEIYPGKVARVEKWLLREFKNAYSNRFWEAYARAEHRQRSREIPDQGTGE